jgi:hypothetical protein
MKIVINTDEKFLRRRLETISAEEKKRGTLCVQTNVPQNKYDMYQSTGKATYEV